MSRKPRIWSGDTSTINGKLVAAVESSNTERVKELLAEGATPDIELPDYTEASPLGVACEQGSIEIAALLLDHGADINYRDGGGGTPLIIACMSGNLNAVSFLLDKKADINIASVSGTALDVARKKDYFEIEKLLLERGGVSERSLKGTGRTFNFEPVKFVVVTFLLGYALLFIAKNIRAIDGDFLTLTTPSVLILITLVVFSNLRSLLQTHVRMLFVTLLYIGLFPLARESTHYDPVQVPMTVGTFAFAVVFLFLAAIVYVKNRFRKRKYT